MQGWKPTAKLQGLCLYLLPCAHLGHKWEIKRKREHNKNEAGICTTSHMLACSLPHHHTKAIFSSGPIFELRARIGYKKRSAQSVKHMLRCKTKSTSKF
jgi:hypothetical protein